MAGGMNPFMAAMKAKADQNAGGSMPAGMGGQSGGSTKGAPPAFLNRGKGKSKADKGRQGAISRRLAMMKK